MRWRTLIAPLMIQSIEPPSRISRERLGALRVKWRSPEAPCPSLARAIFCFWTSARWPTVSMPTAIFRI